MASQNGQPKTQWTDDSLGLRELTRRLCGSLFVISLVLFERSAFCVGEEALSSSALCTPEQFSRICFYKQK